MRKKSVTDLIISGLLYIIMTAICIITLYPMVYIVLASFSDAMKVASSDSLLIIPDGIYLEAYKYVFKSPNIMLGYRNTIFYVITSTSLGVLLTIISGYVLSRKWLLGKNFLMTFVMITMFFSGGMIPTYLVVKWTGLLNSPLSVIIPGVVSVYNVIITKTFISEIPDALEEAAKIDGANDIGILFKIFVPVSLPVIAVNILYYAVAQWNGWYNAMLYIRNRELYPLQMFLREILINNEMNEMGGVMTSELAQNVKYATIIVSILPILTVYPFLQKYFVQGIMIGSVKG